ncbi:hypothetical protein BDQ12DRAFT_674001 [Crucibulum laeve]|uniref:Uncharacterized protein n=1 Tax=Crucibulum laeve TaxID=68775 RepID=A0A5C3MK21_9AGAR|nr:hypothetical protein BDQ12DRAFT_674001 [Crucibulum laeve]
MEQELPSSCIMVLYLVVHTPIVAAVRFPPPQILRLSSPTTVVVVSDHSTNGKQSSIS